MSDQNSPEDHPIAESPITETAPAESTPDLDSGTDGGSSSSNVASARFPLSTKLLLILFLILGAVIVFLSASAILVFQEDKRAYIYQTQEGTAQMGGRDFANLGKRSLDSLKLALVQVDPWSSAPVSGTGTQHSSIKTLLENQADLIQLTIELLDTRSWGEGKTILSEVSSQAEKKGYAGIDERLKKEWIKLGFKTLQKQGFIFFNLSTVDQPKMMGVMVADADRSRGHSGELAVAFGVVSLDDFSLATGGSRLTLADSEGWILYDSEPAEMLEKKSIKEDPLFQSALLSQTVGGAKEFDVGKEHFLGTYFKPGIALVAMTRMSWQTAMDVTYALTERIALLGLMSITVAVIFAILFAKSLTGPLNRLYAATLRVADGNFDINVPPTTRDEIGALCGSFNVMSKKIQDLLLESMEKVRMEGELAIAARVQQTLIPPPALENERMKLLAHYQSASECGGDWWGVFPLDHRLAFMIADATGHGVHSALITASAKGCFSFIQKLAEENKHFPLTPAVMLSYANRVVFDSGAGQIMMTMFAAVFDFEKGEMVYANAGHNPPWVVRPGAKPKFESLYIPGNRVGESAVTPQYEEKSVQFGPGDLFFFYTDGLLEGGGDSTAMKKVVRKKIEAGFAQGVEDVVRIVREDWDVRNAGKAAPDDDVTYVALQIKSTGGQGSA